MYFSLTVLLPWQHTGFQTSPILKAFLATFDVPFSYFRMMPHCLISNREGLGTSLLIIRLATIDPHSQKEDTEVHKIPKFGVNQASFDRDTAIERRQN